MAVDRGFAGVSPVGGGCEGCARLAGENGRLRARVSELEDKVEELRRAEKRQAAPFSRDESGEASGEPGRPGRKAGSRYGTKAHRPAPEEIDERSRRRLGMVVSVAGRSSLSGSRTSIRRSSPSRGRSVAA